MPWAAAPRRAQAAQLVAVRAPSVVLDDAALIVDADTGEMVAGYFVRMFNGDALAAKLRSLAPKNRDPQRLKLNWKISPRGVGVPTATGRLSGITVPSLTFGATPAVAARRRYAAQNCVADRKYPTEWAEMRSVAAGTYRQLSELGLPFGDADSTIAPVWKIDGTPFTSAILNFPGAAYPFHMDSGNLPGSWSMQLNLRGRFSSGGVLVFPEYDIGLACANGSVVVFPGGGLWHGVTPIGGLRMSAVFYAKAGLRDAAATVEEEIAAGNARRTAYERASVTDGA